MQPIKGDHVSGHSSFVCETRQILTANATPLRVAAVPAVKTILMFLRSLGVMDVEECRTGAVSLGPITVTILRVIV